MAASDQTLLGISCGRPEDVAGKIILFQAGIYLFKVNNRHKVKVKANKVNKKDTRTKSWTNFIHFLAAYIVDGLNAS